MILTFKITKGGDLAHLWAFIASLLDVQQLVQCEAFTVYGRQVAAVLEDRKVPPLYPDQGKLVNKINYNTIPVVYVYIANMNNEHSKHIAMENYQCGLIKRDTTIFSAELQLVFGSYK